VGITNRMIVTQWLIIGILALGVSDLWANTQLKYYSVSAYTNPNAIRGEGELLPSQVTGAPSNIFVMRVGFRQYSNPHINSSSTLSLENQLNVMVEPDPMVSGMVLVYPNPLKMRSGASIVYSLTKNTQVTIQIYDMFGHRVHQEIRPSGAIGGTGGINRVPLSALSFRMFDPSAGVYFLVLLDEQSKLLGKSKFVIVP
jgi:hypothetical protein